MAELQVDYTDDRGRTFYKPAVLRIAGVSKYREDQFSFEGVDGFWQMDEHAWRSVDSRIPPVGTVATFTLRTNPKRGENAKPGSLYRDIIHIQKAPEGAQPVAQAPEAPREAWSGSQSGSGGNNNGYWDERERQIKLGMAFNNLTQMICSQGDHDWFFPDGESAQDLWNKWFHEASRGLPLTPVSDEPSALDDAADLDAQAQAHLGEETTEMSF